MKSAEYLQRAASYLEENSEARRVSNFLDWAHEKLTAEIRQIEEMEKEHGTGEWCKPTRGQKTRSQKLRIIDEIDELRRDGSGLKPAAKLCGICKTTYFQWREQLGLGKFNGGERVFDLTQVKDAGSTPATSTLTNDQ